jgi:hypothetical protein
VPTNTKRANAGPDPDGTLVRAGKKRFVTLYVVCLTGHRVGRRTDVIGWVRKNWDRLGGPVVGGINQNGGPTLKTVSDLVDYALVRKIMEEQDTVLTEPVDEDEMNQFVMELVDSGAMTKEIVLRVPETV